MGLFDFLFGGKSEEPSVTKAVVDAEEHADKYKELIRFINFVIKIKSFVHGENIYITYTEPERNNGYYDVGKIYASWTCYDFDEIQFAREAALSSSEGMRKMVLFYYREISKKAGLSQDDWPYRIDEFYFEELLQGTGSFIELIPDEHLDDIFTFKVTGGIDMRNALQVYNTVNNLLKSNFSELQITKNHATPYSMGITIQI